MNNNINRTILVLACMFIIIGLYQQQFKINTVYNIPELFN